MANFSAPYNALPPLPSYTLSPRPPLIPGIPDSWLSLILPIIAYWAFSMLFHFIDTRDYFPQYRLHTPAEVLKRNHVSRYEVVRDVIIQQVIQTIVGGALTLLDDDEFVGKDQYNVAVWAQRVRIAQSAIPILLRLVGIDAQALALKASSTSTSLGAALAGGSYKLMKMGNDGLAVPTFATWELSVANIIYWILDPAVRFFAAIVIVDTWQYFLHRAMHMNKWLYTTFHSRHHRLYVPYAYGALYNHPFEGFLLDTLGAGLAYLIVGLTARQATCFFTGSTLKTVDDHCGYALPWDPLQHLTSNNAGYHDVHHQSWGIKTNFSQPFFTFWDRLLGTAWKGGDVSARYERARLAADRKMKQDATAAGLPNNITNSEKDTKERRRSSISIGKAFAQAAASKEQVLQDSAAGGRQILAEEAAEEADAKAEVKSYEKTRTPRKRTLQSSTAQAGTLKGLRDRVNSGSGPGRLHGTAGVLGYDASR